MARKTPRHGLHRDMLLFIFIASYAAFCYSVWPLNTAVYAFAYGIICVASLSLRSEL